MTKRKTQRKKTRANYKPIIKGGVYETDYENHLKFKELRRRLTQMANPAFTEDIPNFDFINYFNQLFEFNNEQMTLSDIIRFLALTIPPIYKDKLYSNKTVLELMLEHYWLIEDTVHLGIIDQLLELPDQVFRVETFASLPIGFSMDNITDRNRVSLTILDNIRFDEATKLMDYMYIYDFAFDKRNYAIIRGMIARNYLIPPTNFHIRNSDISANLNNELHAKGRFFETIYVLRQQGADLDSEAADELYEHLFEHYYNYGRTSDD